jgi:hypothetical protein
LGQRADADSGEYSPDSAFQIQPRFLAPQASVAEGLGNRTRKDTKRFDHAIKNNRGGIWLELSEDQYQKLKRPWSFP